MGRRNKKGAASIVGKLVAMGDKDRIIVEVLADDVPRTVAETQASALADGVEPDASVTAEDFSG